MGRMGRMGFVAAGAGGGGRWWVGVGVGDLFYGVGGRSMKSMWQVTS